MAERLPTEKARQRGWQALCGRCGSPDSCMWCLANVEQTRNIRVIILARIRPEEGDKLGEPGRRQVIARAIQGSRDGGEASAYLLPQLFLWIGPRVFAYGLLQIR